MRRVVVAEAVLTADREENEDEDRGAHGAQDTGSRVLGAVLGAGGHHAGSNGWVLPVAIWAWRRPVGVALLAMAIVVIGAGQQSKRRGDDKILTMTRMLHLGLAAALLCLAVPGQDDDAKFNLSQAKTLNAFAKKALKKGFPRQAKLIWLRVIKLYDADNKEAHAGIGETRAGPGRPWVPKSGFSYPTTDSGSGKEGEKLFREYESMSKRLAAAHRRKAKEWAKADRTDKSRFHYQMLLRWVRQDAEAETALRLKAVGALSGTDLEETIYNNSKKIEAAVTAQAKINYQVQRLTDSKQPLLDKAQVEYVTVKSKHFTLRGDPDQEEDLKEALVWAERALHVVEVAFPKSAFPNDATRWNAEWCYFVAKDTYKQVLRANAEMVPNLEWKLENTSTSGLGGIVVGATGSKKVLQDACVRQVAQTWSRFGSAGLREGIGHTFVGMVFNNNRLFSVDLEKQQGTTASEEDRQYTSPDFDVWKDLNLELAWKNTGGVPARDLPFCEAAKFTNQQRIKAWSFSDYMMRRDPVLLQKMDRLALTMRGQNARVSSVEFADEFAKKYGLSLAELDKGWEDFWTEASPVLKAIRNNQPPLASISKGVEKWLAALNKARKEHGKIPVKWSANLSKRCRDHAVYLRDNKDLRGPEHEHTQDAEVGGTHLGAMFAQMAIVETNTSLGRAKKMFKRWMNIPGYRDALLNNYIGAIGLFTEGKILVMNTVSALGAPASKSARGYFAHPRDGMRGIPGDVAVADLGPELQAVLAKQGKGDLKRVGYPLTMHFGVGISGDRASYKCTVSTDRGKRIDGVIVMDSGKIRRTTAPGVVTFYPFEKIKGMITAIWTWRQGGREMRVKATFMTK